MTAVVVLFQTGLFAPGPGFRQGDEIPRRTPLDGRLGVTAVAFDCAVTPTR